jgi:thiol-disulfide isomerase/thioredoxin
MIEIVNKERIMRNLLFFLLSCCVIIASAEALSSIWSEGTPAVGTVDTLAKGSPTPIDLPEMIHERLKGKTAIFYFSPTCPHCQEVMGELNQLASDFSSVSWIGIASSRTSPEMLQAFSDVYKPTFPLIIDLDGSFARVVSARATPNVYVVKKAEKSAKKNAILFESYLPYYRGLAPLFKMRNSEELDPFAHFQGYQGSQICVNCHQQEGKSWMLTHHAQAYYTLYIRDKATDEKCVQCHVVGLGEKTGFQMGDHKSPKANVGCEACHGPSGPHDGEAVQPISTCDGCHDAEHSINFSVAKGLPHIDHFISNTMSDKELRKRIEEVSNGTADKPLLAFNSGETVGVKVCQECHLDTHPKDPHQQAMRTLPRKAKKKLDCVRCHATEEMIGEEPQEVDDFHLEDGVGCESCHGSGKEHAANPTTENIVGLGDSCPVCVVEAICTSCHNKQWDPNWNLDQRLEALP